MKLKTVLHALCNYGTKVMKKNEMAVYVRLGMAVGCRPREAGGLCVPRYLILTLNPKLRLNDVGLCL